MIDGLQRMRYCGIGEDSRRGMAWHSDDRRGTMFRCCCVKLFRLPGRRLSGVAVKNRKDAARRYGMKKRDAIFERL